MPLLDSAMPREEQADETDEYADWFRVKTAPPSPILGSPILGAASTHSSSSWSGATGRAVLHVEQAPEFEQADETDEYADWFRVKTAPPSPILGSPILGAASTHSSSSWSGATGRAVLHVEQAPEFDMWLCDASPPLQSPFTAPAVMPATMPTPPKPSMTEGNVDSSTIMQEAAVLHELAHELDAGSECGHSSDEETVPLFNTDGEEDCSLPVSHLRSLAHTLGLHVLPHTSSTSIDELGLQAVQEKLYALTKANMQGYKNWDAADSERGFQCASSRASGPSALVLLDRAGSQDVVAFAMWCVVDELHAWEKQLMPQGITVTHPPFLPHIPFSPHPAPHTPVSGACVVLLLC
jgi:hypothetical protein